MTGFVYAIKAGDFVKIGYSASPLKRAAAIRGGNPVATLVGFFQATVQQEKELHRRFAAWRVSGEWFRHEGDVQEFVGTIPAVPPPAVKRRAPGTSHPLRRFRDQKELTLEGLAGLLGVKKNTVWRWENGRIPERPMWARIEKVTGIKPDQIVRFVAEGAAA